MLSVLVVVFRMFGQDILIVSSIFLTFLLFFAFDKSFLSFILYSKNFFLIYFAVALFSTIINIPFGNDNYVSGLIFTTSFICLVFLGKYISKSLIADKVVSFHTFFLAVSVVFGFIEFLTKKNILLSLFFVDNLTGTGRICSFFVHPIIFSVFLIVFYWLVFLNKKMHWLIKSAFLIITIVCLYGTFSRSSWIAFLLTNMVYLLRNFIFKKITPKKFILGIMLLSSAIIVMATTGVFNIFVDGLVERISNIDESVSYLQRIGGWEYLIRDSFYNSNIVQLLFGHGYKGSFMSLLNTTIVITGFFTTDNSYVSVFYNYGIISFTIVLCLLLSLAVFLFSKRFDRYEYKGIVLSLIGIFSVAFFFEIDLFLNIASYFYLYIGFFLTRKQGSLL